MDDYFGSDSHLFSNIEGFHFLLSYRYRHLAQIFEHFVLRMLIIREVQKLNGIYPFAKSLEYAGMSTEQDLVMQLLGKKNRVVEIEEFFENPDWTIPLFSSNRWRCFAARYYSNNYISKMSNFRRIQSKFGSNSMNNFLHRSTRTHTTLSI